MKGEEEEEEERACVYGGSVCVCLSVHREVCTSFFFALTPPTPLSCDRINDDEEVLRGGDRRGSKKDCSGCRVHTCVPEERQK